MDNSFIEVRKLSKCFDRKVALDQLSLTISKGSIFGLLGPNGAGKTTFIRILTQIIGPDEGQILLEGRQILKSDIYRIGYMPEERGLYRKMKVEEQVHYFARLKGLSSAQAEKEIRYWFRLFSIDDWKNKKVEELSKGMQQKIQFIATVIHKPEIIILDEPFTGFDPVNTEIIKQEVLKLQKNGSTIILSTHRMESVEELCDKICLINRSKKVLEGEVDEIRHRYKEHSFEMVISHQHGELPFKKMTGFLLEKEEAYHDNTIYFRFKVADSIPTNEVVRQVLEHADLISFREVLPSVNDIFIKLVRENIV